MKKKKSSQKLVTWLNGLTRTATLTLSPGISLRRINLYYYWTLWYKSQEWIIPKYSDHPKELNKHRIIVTKSHVRTYFQRGAWRISHTHSIWSITIGIKIPRALCQQINIKVPDHLNHHCFDSACRLVRLLEYSIHCYRFSLICYTVHNYAD